MSDSEIARPRRLARLFAVTRVGVLLILVAHFLACVGSMTLMGFGFPLFSASGIAYRILPTLVAMALVASVATPARWNVRSHVLRLLICAWACVGVAVLIRFPATSPRLVLACLLAALVVSAALATTDRVQRNRRERVLRWLGSIAVGSLIACCAIGVLAAPPPSTIAGPVGPTHRVLNDAPPERRHVRFAENVGVDLPGATVVISNGKRVAYVEPLLSFNQRSPDGCWTIFASRRDRQAARHELQSTRIEASKCLATYDDVIVGGGDEGEANDELAGHGLIVERVSPTKVEIDATASVPQAVYTHLNTFAQVTLAGHRRLSIAFSAAPEKRIDVKPAGYPFGAPARFAYVDGRRVLHVVEASNAEKGPFTELASGVVGEALTITLFDGDDAFLEVSLHDFVDQASVAPSPSAGYGVPQNAIEFSLDSDRPGAAATIFVSLASTSVGRGWQSVGHAAGTYRNRITIRLPMMP